MKGRFSSTNAYIFVVQFQNGIKTTVGSRFFFVKTEKHADCVFFDFDVIGLFFYNQKA